MNTTGAGSPDVTNVITAAHLTIIVILAIAAMLAIWWGGRRRRARAAAAEESVHRREIAETAAPPARAVTVQPEPVETPPTAPSPPPLADAPTVATRAVTPGGDGAAAVTMLKGLGPKVAARLAELGITRVDQLAALSPAEAETLDGDLGAFSGRMARDRWIEQALLLTAGDRAGFEAKFGKLG